MRNHKRDTYGGWLKTEIEVFVTYHNHKETMAWTATALFLAAAVAFLSAIPQIATEHQCTATAVIVLASLSIAGFVIMQFCKRWSAADTCDGLRAALTKVYGGGYLNIAVSTDPVPGLPSFVAEEIVRAARRKRRWRCDFYKDPRWWSELASYFLLVLACVGMLMAVWNPPPKKESKVEEIERQLAAVSAKVETLSHEFIVRLAESEERLRSHIEESEKPHNRCSGWRPASRSTAADPNL